MEFNNASKGIKKIFTAEVLALIAAICAVITAIFVVVMAVATKAESAGGAVASLGAAGLFGIATAVLGIIAYIFKIIGVNNAGKDEPAFKIALYLIFAGLVVAVVGSFFSGNATVKSVIDIASEVINLVITIYIIQGCCNLASKLGRDDVVNKGNTIFKLIICVYVLAIIANLIVAIFNGTGAAVTAGIIAIVSAVLNVIQYFIYLSFLSKAKKMFAE